MVQVLGLWLKTLRVPKVGLRAFWDELTAAKLNFLLWGWNWICTAIVKEWYEVRTLEGTEICGRLESWTIEQWAQVLEPYVCQEGNLLYDHQSVKVTQREVKTFITLFKSPRLTKNGWRTTDYIDPLQHNVPVTLMQILKPSRTMYMTSWQVGFMERVVTGKPIHWAWILWSVNNKNVNDRFWVHQICKSTFFINFYWGMEWLTKEKNRKFPLERKIIGSEDEGAQGGNKVVSKINDVEPA